MFPICVPGNYSCGLLGTWMTGARAGNPKISPFDERANRETRDRGHFQLLMAAVSVCHRTHPGYWSGWGWMESAPGLSANVSWTATPTCDLYSVHKQENHARDLTELGHIKCRKKKKPIRKT